MSELHLYSYRGCPFARRTRMTLIEKGLDFELNEIDLKNKPADFASISPYGKVPVLLHGDEHLYESRIINEYLDEAFPGPHLMPADPLGKAQVRIWMDYCDTRFSSASWQLMQAGDNPEARTTAENALQECFLFIEREGLRKLSDGPFWLGENLSLLDIQYMPFFQRYVDSPGADLIPAECTRIKLWISQMAERDSFMETAA